MPRMYNVPSPKHICFEWNLPFGDPQRTCLFSFRFEGLLLGYGAMEACQGVSSVHISQDPNPKPQSGFIQEGKLCGGDPDSRLPIIRLISQRGRQSVSEAKKAKENLGVCLNVADLPKEDISFSVDGAYRSRSWQPPCIRHLCDSC